MSNPVPPARRSRLLALMLLVAAAATAAVGVRAWNRGAERRAALELAEQGPPDRAAEALRVALDRAPDDPALLKALVALRVNNGASVAEVEPLTERWCRADPDDPAAFAARADALRRLSRLPEAVGAAERAAALAPGDPAHQTALAALYLASGRFADAAREYRSLLSAQPGRPEFALPLVRAEWELGNLAEAARVADELLARSPPPPGALLMRGLIHFRAGEFERALAVLGRVTPAGPEEHKSALYHRAQALDRLGRADEARKVYAELAAVEDAARYATDADQRPDDMALQVRAARALLAAGQPDPARRRLEAARARLGTDRAALDLLAACYEALGRPDLAARARAATP